MIYRVSIRGFNGGNRVESPPQEVDLIRKSNGDLVWNDEKGLDIEGVDFDPTHIVIYELMDDEWVRQHELPITASSFSWGAS